MGAGVQRRSASLRVGMGAGGPGCKGRLFPIGARHRCRVTAPLPEPVQSLWLVKGQGESQNWG